MATIRAEIDPLLLVWARSLPRMSREVAAKKIGVPPERLQSWERGHSRPTIRQLRSAARVYGQSLATFFLPEPPEEFDPTSLPDYRRHAGVMADDMSSDLALDIRTNAERRQSYLELLDGAGGSPPPLVVRASMEESPEVVGGRLRGALGITNEQQRSWRNERVAFNRWRTEVEALGVLVFQTSVLPTENLRGYSIAEYPAPVIVVNRKDLPRSRTFTLLHELTHLALHASGICDLSTDPTAPAEDQPLEVFCNHAAAAALVPRERLLTEDLVSGSEKVEWSREDLWELAKRYSVSGEVILRRLLTVGRATEAQYRQYHQAVSGRKDRKKPGGRIPVVVDTVSISGKPYVGEVLRAVDAGRITVSRAAGLLGVRIKHFDSLGAAVGA